MIFARLYLFFQSHKTILFATILALTLLACFFASKIKLNNDITRFLPRDKQSQEINTVLQNLKIKDKLIFHVFLKDSANVAPERLAEIAEILADTLEKISDGYINEMRFKVSDDLMAETYSIFQEHLPVFLDDQDLRSIQKKLNPDSIKKTLGANYKALLSPSGLVLGKMILQDPLHLTPIALKKVQSLQLNDNYELFDGYIQTKDHKHQLLFITPSVPPSEAETNGKFLDKADKIIRSLRESHNDVVIEYYGAAAVSLGNSRQVKQDSLVTGSVALLLILILLFLYFRRLDSLFLILLPVAFGGVFSVAALYLLKTEISAIALGAGSVVLGIAINYSLHLLTHQKHTRSLVQVLQDLSMPMLTGCCTTVAAFLSLQFAKSEALHDFGLFAGFSLVGAALFSLLVLPHLIRGKENSSTRQDPKLFTSLLSLRPDKNKFIVIGAFILTIVFAFAARHVRFESDMMAMSFQSEELNQAQSRLENINKASLQSVYVVSSAPSFEAALRLNEQTADRLADLKQRGLVTEFSSPSTLLVSDSLQKRRLLAWQNFWTVQKIDSLKQFLHEFAPKFKFKPGAFEGFIETLQKTPLPLSAESVNYLNTHFTSDLTTKHDGKFGIISAVKPEPGKKETLYADFKDNPNVVVFDRQQMTSLFVSVIQSDFNTILFTTAFLVFGFMLLSHGRIELAIINFLPMFISWIWILGVMAIFGLTFNIINIIISTFIFGLGDDYSIFILDGLSNEYKHGRRTLASFKGSIILSALTNIIGIGVLIFAEHPALRSIAAITIIGMGAVLIVSFITQPLIYNFLILNRKKRGLLPYTFFNLFITGFGFIIFIIGSLVMSVVGLILFFLIPAPKNKKKLVFHYLLMYICKIMIYLFFNVRKNIINPNNEDFSKPAIIVANHQSHIDLAMILMLHPKLVVFTNDWVWNSPFYGFIVKLADFYPASRGYDKSVDKMRALTKAGYSVLIFPEGTRSTTGEILRFHKGAFYLAQQLNLDILPLLMHGTGDLVTKGDFHFKEGSLTLKFLDRISASDSGVGLTYQERTKHTVKLMRQKYAELKAECETVDYYRPRLIKNYIYKGPVLEWYCRVKVGLEKNYRFFESRLPKQGIITDVGCGYGFLSLMLAMTGKQRTIYGVDYDTEKISIAQNCVSAGANVQFSPGDVTSYDFTASDAFVISDVLHYLKPEQQVALIETCVAHLNPGGTMIIRDADADKKRRHLGTRYTEFFSTRSGFNKTAGALHFTSADLIKTTLGKFAHIQYQVVDDTQLTSNITFVVRDNRTSAS